MILRIDPKVDYAFKKLFGSEANKALLIDLLNAVLDSLLPEPIVDVQILNPFNDKDDLNDKLSILDVKARDNAGRLYNIEMQIAAFGAYPKHILYYWANMYQGQLHEGESFMKLQPAISISFVNTILFPDAPFHQEFVILSRHDPKIVFCDDLSIHLIELPKFSGTLETLSSPLDRWCYFLRYGETLDATAVPDALRTPPIEKAVEVLRVMTQNDIERQRYESRQKALHDEATWRESAEWSREQGMKEGLQKGRQEGLKEGIVNSLEFGLEIKFGQAGNDLVGKVRQIADIAKLHAIQQALRTAQSIEEIQNLLK